MLERARHPPVREDGGREQLTQQGPGPVRGPGDRIGQEDADSDQHHGVHPESERLVLGEPQAPQYGRALLAEVAQALWYSPSTEPLLLSK